MVEAISEWLPYLTDRLGVEEALPGETPDVTIRWEDERLFCDWGSGWDKSRCIGFYNYEGLDAPWNQGMEAWDYPTNEIYLNEWAMVAMGWFVDPTPHDDSEFDMATLTYGTAKDGEDSQLAYDLLTIFKHEFGHALGLTHNLVPGNLDVMGLCNHSERRHPTFNDTDRLQTLYPPAICSLLKDGDPAFYVPFSEGVAQVEKGEEWCYDVAPANFGFVSGICTEADTFCMHYYDLLGWTIEGVTDPEGEPFILDVGAYHWSTVCIRVPCEASIGAGNTLVMVFAFTDIYGICAPDSGDCENPNLYGGVFRYSTISKNFEVIESPPVLYILQDTLYLVERGQKAAYIPFSICNGDPCAPPATYGYNIRNVGIAGRIPTIDRNGLAENVPGRECMDVYGIIDAGDASVCDYDELTIIVWTQDGLVYDTCVQQIHVVEPVPVPLFTTPVVTILVLAVILSSAVVMYGGARKRV